MSPKTERTSKSSRPINPNFEPLAFEMAKKKAKKVISQPPPSELPTGDDDGLLDDLAAQLDDQSTDSQTAATVVSQVDHAKADELEATARGSKDRWKARQVRISFKWLNFASGID